MQKTMSLEAEVVIADGQITWEQSVDMFDAAEVEKSIDLGASILHVINLNGQRAVMVTGTSNAIVSI